MLENQVVAKLQAGSKTQAELQSQLKCTFGELAVALRRLSDSGRIAMQPDGSWCHADHIYVPQKQPTPPIRFGNASMPVMQLEDLPVMQPDRSDAQTNSVRLIYMV